MLLCVCGCVLGMGAGRQCASFGRGWVARSRQCRPPASHAATRGTHSRTPIQGLGTLNERQSHGEGHTYRHTYTHTYVHTHTYIHTRAHRTTHAHTHTRNETHRTTRTHTYIHTYVQTYSCCLSVCLSVCGHRLQSWDAGTVYVQLLTALQPPTEGTMAAMMAGAETSPRGHALRARPRRAAPVPLDVTRTQTLQWLKLQVRTPACAPSPPPSPPCHVRMHGESEQD
jgi:hypothetical protein